MNQETQAINAPVAKAVAAMATATGAQIMDAGEKAQSVFAELFTPTWPNIASMFAALYTLALLTEFFWKRFWRPLLERFGWIKPKPRKQLTAREIEQILSDRETDHSPL